MTEDKGDDISRLDLVSTIGFSGQVEGGVIIHPDRYFMFYSWYSCEGIYCSTIDHCLYCPAGLLISFQIFAIAIAVLNSISIYAVVNLILKFFFSS